VIEELDDALVASPRPVDAPGGVLVVDDDYAMRETTVEILAAADIRAEAVGSAADALDRVGTLQPELALVDHRLPDANGIDLGRALKDRDADLGVVVVTGYASLENAIAAVGHVDGYLTKPVPPVELLRVVRAGLDGARLRRENRELLGQLRRTNLLLEESVEGRTRELSDLLAMAEALAATTDLDEVVDSCLRSASEVTGARYAGLYLNEGAAGEDPDLRLRASTGASLLPDRLERSPLTAIDDVIVDLTVGGHEVGVIVLGVATRRNPMFLATLAGSAAIAIQNAQRLTRERELSRMKSTFLAAVSHELRTPLTAVIGFADMLRNGLGSASQERQGEMTTHILQQSRRLGELIDDLLDASRVEFGGLRVKLDDVDVGAVVARHADSLGRSPCPVVLRVAAGLPRAVADEARLEQVVANLVGNAIRHSPAGSPVEVRADAVDGQVRLVVADHGSGIAPELLPQLFEPFTRGKAGAGGRSDGLGLGLYIARGLVEAMGGTIAVRSRAGGGSEFTVLLAAVDVA
jgi:two-component system, OmpR family, phosphate regulon sensor histidine kinase PhoR